MTFEVGFLGTMPGQATPVEIVGRFLGHEPVPLDEIAQALGLDVVYSRVLPDDISGKIERAGPRYRVTVNARHTRQRQRFTLAHEIAHYVMHRDLIGDGVTDNAMYRSGLSDAIEQQANRYAADILMPASTVRRAYRNGVKSFAEMAQLFDVSTDAARIRMRDLRLG